MGGHDLAAILEALDEAEGQGDRPSVILADTIKGWGLPLAADPGNHGALLTTAQIEAFRAACGVAPGEEWQAFPPGSPEAALIRRRPALFSAP
ncbi:MAG: pyruvate dehydrogenase, partial [candidate division NC10 bacterium]